MVVGSAWRICLVLIFRRRRLRLQKINPRVNAGSQLDHDAFVAGGFVSIGLFEFRGCDAEDGAFDDVGLSSSELEVAMIRGAACRDKFSVVNANDLEAITDQRISLAV